VFGSNILMNLNFPIDQQAMEISQAVRELLLDLQVYGSKHAVDDALGKDLQALIAAGALSPKSVSFVAAHRVRFLGFRFKPIRPDIPVLDVELADRTRHIIGFRDGHAELTAKAAEPPQ
jgi:hypothetical protein